MGAPPWVPASLPAAHHVLCCLFTWLPCCCTLLLLPLLVCLPACGVAMLAASISPLPSNRNSTTPAGKQRNLADDELVVAQMREQLLARMRSLGSLQPPAEATACLEVSSGWGS